MAGINPAGEDRPSMAPVDPLALLEHQLLLYNELVEGLEQVYKRRFIVERQAIINYPIAWIGTTNNGGPPSKLGQGIIIPNGMWKSFLLLPPFVSSASPWSGPFYYVMNGGSRAGLVNGPFAISHPVPAAVPLFPGDKTIALLATAATIAGLDGPVKIGLSTRPTRGRESIRLD